MNGYEPLEWSIYIEYCHWANFFIGIPTLLSTTTISIFWLCKAAANVMEDQSGFQGYKTFPLGLLMAGIQFHMSIMCGS